VKIAFIDLVFAWPPPGGAQADLYHTIVGIQGLGHAVHLFGPRDERAWRFGGFDSARLPFPATAVPFTHQSFKPREIARQFRNAVDAWKPDVAFVGFGRFLKPYILHALAHYPLISRYYMYEHICLRGFGLWKDEATCPNDLLHTPNVCRRCALNCWGAEIRSGRLSLYPGEYVHAKAYSASYYRLFVDSLRSLKAAIVNNELAKERLEGFCPYVTIIPGGVHVGEFDAALDRCDHTNDKKIILMAGRVDDPLKGMDVLVEACRALSKVRGDFEVWVTGCDPTANYPWLKQLGWQDHSGIMKVYQQADIFVVPSLWEEPYGLVAVEAMAAGLPVCASRVGGLKSLVHHDETGYLFEAGESAELALYLQRLLNEPETRREMGQAARKRAETDYDWARIIPRYYPPLLEKVRQ
jgi:glycosyltransferase involved in cell wall biosynthesis